MKGSCLCGSVKFEISGDLPNFYQCYCSLCQKVTGSMGITATVIPIENFTWIKGRESIKTFKKPSGYRADFCSECGSSVPNQLRGTPRMWIPAGTLDCAVNSRVVLHIYTGSAASWSKQDDQCQFFEQGVKSFEQLENLLNT